MTGERVCEIHGPYDGRYANCPYCEKQGGRPPQPAPLDEQLTGNFGGHGDDMSTVPPRRSGGRAQAYNDDETQLPRRRAGRRVDSDELDETKYDRPPTGLLGWLVFKEGMRRGTMNLIGDEVTLGRKAKIVIQDDKVSELHAKFAIQEGQFVVSDVLSKNGTYVNGVKIDRVTPIKENDEIRVGDTVLVLKTLEP